MATVQSVRERLHTRCAVYIKYVTHFVTRAWTRPHWRRLPPRQSLINFDNSIYAIAGRLSTTRVCVCVCMLARVCKSAGARTTRSFIINDLYIMKSNVYVCTRAHANAFTNIRSPRLRDFLPSNLISPVCAPLFMLWGLYIYKMLITSPQL